MKLEDKRYIIKWSVDVSGKEFSGENSFYSNDECGAKEKAKRIVATRVGKNKDDVIILSVSED